MLLSQARVPVGPSGPGLIMSDIQVMIPVLATWDIRSKNCVKDGSTGSFSSPSV